MQNIHFVPVVTLSTQDNTKLLEQLKLSFKRTTNCNEYQLRVSTQEQNQTLDYLIDSRFQGVNRLFVSLFENNSVRIGNAEYFLLKVEIKDFNFGICGRNVFDQSVQPDIWTYGNIATIATGQGYGYTTCSLLDYANFKENYKLIAINLSKQQAPNADSKAIQETIFIGNLERAGSTTMFFIIKEVKKLRFLTTHCESTVNVFYDIYLAFYFWY